MAWNGRAPFIFLDLNLNEDSVVRWNRFSISKYINLGIRTLTLHCGQCRISIPGTYREMASAEARSWSRYRSISVLYNPRGAWVLISWKWRTRSQSGDGHFTYSFPSSMCLEHQEVKHPLHNALSTPRCRGADITSASPVMATTPKQYFGAAYTAK